MAPTPEAMEALELANCTALPDDLVFTAAGTIGQVGLIPQKSRHPEYVISNKQLRARVDKSKANPLFLFYWFTPSRGCRHMSREERVGPLFR